MDGKLAIELHIMVSYGLNISSVVRSISHRVKDEVEQATGLKVARVDRFRGRRNRLIWARGLCKPASNRPIFAGKLL